jgi:hypothetical protein
MRWHLLRGFLAYVQQKSDVWIATGEEIADHYAAQETARGASV